MGLILGLSFTPLMACCPPRCFIAFKRSSLRFDVHTHHRNHWGLFVFRSLCRVTTTRTVSLWLKRHNTGRFLKQRWRALISASFDVYAFKFNVKGKKSVKSDKLSGLILSFFLPASPSLAQQTICLLLQNMEHKFKCVIGNFTKRRYTWCIHA